MVYPGGRSSIRFERVIEGVEAAEKYRILREEYEQSHQTEALHRLNNVLEGFKSGHLASEEEAAYHVNRLQRVLNGLTE